jgi:hypothetical protein
MMSVRTTRCAQPIFDSKTVDPREFALVIGHQSVI